MIICTYILKISIFYDIIIKLKDEGINMRKRSILSMVVLSIITCGIYYLIAFVQVFSDINYALNEKDTSLTDLLLNIVTCGLWGIYCFYQYSKKLARLGAEDNTIINIVLSLFGLQIIALCIMQSNMNTLIERGNQ